MRIENRDAAQFAGSPNLPKLQSAPSPQGFGFAEPSAARPEVGSLPSWLIYNN
ncbi:MAG: hypothetical protein OIN66_18505 [Candidatus Methanoperedens sp.]|nr:hypothetical protein [Candidatus Methanoperedens sp.]